MIAAIVLNPLKTPVFSLPRDWIGKFCNLIDMPIFLTTVPNFYGSNPYNELNGYVSKPFTSFFVVNFSGHFLKFQ